MDSENRHTEVETSYDQVPYQSNSFPRTHPDRLATLGHLFGLRTAPVDRCRVLELGCASGGNLIPMAFHLPESKFVGADLSKRQVRQGKKTITDLGLRNIRIEHTSILDIDTSWGDFDFIICHGVYSWVAEKVKEKILAISSRNLAPEGIAYVSYNTYPGWHFRESIRNMMRYHISQFDGTSKRVDQARALIDFLARSVPSDAYYGSMLKSELELIHNVRDWYLFHDHLEDVNTPLYFFQFIESADKHDLQYLGEAELSTMLTSGFPPEVAETLDRISPDIVRAEQYMDFLRNRFFRHTLLCHKDRILNRSLSTDNLDGLLFASAASPQSASVDFSSDVKQAFRSPTGLTINTAFPLTKATFCVLKKYWPRSVDQKTLFREAQQLLANTLGSQEAGHAWNTVLADLLHCYTTKDVELHTWQSDFTTDVSSHPQTSKLAAYQIEQDQSVVNQRHETVELDALGRTLLKGLDGERNREILLAFLKECVKDGTITVNQHGHSISDDTLIHGVLQEALDRTLPELARAALLIR